MLTPEQIAGLTHAVEEKRARRSVALPLEERMARFEALQATAMRLLESNPAALAAFHKRNHHRRRESQVQSLLAELRSHERVRQ